MRSIAWLAPALLTLVSACGGDNTASPVEPPGAEASAKTRMLEGGSAILQDKKPVEALNVYVDGFHFYNGDLQAQMEAHHYCSVMNEDVRQCVIFDGNGREAKLMGVEYIVSRRVFERLPLEERKLWHSHSYEVKSGTLIAPGIPEAAEHELMEQMVGTYGKTWHTWHTDHGNALPVGHPMLMAGFTADGQADPKMIQARDDRMGVDTAERRKAREDLPSPPVVEGANAWEHGEALQLALQPIVANSQSPAGELESDNDESTVPTPTRRIRAHRGQQVYASLPPQN
jgi:hypothetical protein